MPRLLCGHCLNYTTTVLHSPDGKLSLCPYCKRPILTAADTTEAKESNTDGTCTCPTQTLMLRGCCCGALEREKRK